jgi:flagellar protein FlaG
LNKVLNSNTVAEFGYYEKLNRITIKIKDKETGDVIKEIPSEKMLKAFTKACELAGLLVDEKR